MSDDDEIINLICTPSQWPAGIEAIRVQANCGHEVWLSKSGQEILASDKEVKLTCILCVPKHPEAREQFKEKGMFMTLAQREDLNKVLGVDQVDQMVAQWGITMREVI